MKNSITYRLDSGEQVMLRTLNKDDAQTLKRGFAELSPQSRFTRFFTPKNSLSDAQAAYLTDVDQENHVAWAALNEKGIHGCGIGRFIRLEENPQHAEYAITVIDEFQNTGLGTLLFTLIYILALDRGVKYFNGYLVHDNRHFLERLKALNAEVQMRGDVYQMKIPITDDFSNYPKGVYTKRFINRFHLLRGLMADSFINPT